MPHNQDFFSPDAIDEHVERPTFPPISQQTTPIESSIRLVHDLHTLYSREEAAQKQSLQRVWERLEAAYTHRHDEVPVQVTPSRLYALQPPTPVMRKALSARPSKPKPILTVLAALIFLGMMIGSLLALVHFTQSQLGAHPIATSTPTLQLGTPTPIPGYAYPLPGKTVSISQPSSAGFIELTWSQDSKQVAACTQGQVWIWEVDNSTQPLVFDPKAGNGPVVVAWSPGAPLLAVGTNQVQMINPSGNVLSFHYPALASDSTKHSAARVTALAWSPDGRLLAVAGHDPVLGNEVNIWDVNKGGQPLYTFTGQQAGNAINSLSWSSDGRYVASANGQSVQAWDRHTGEVIFQHTLTGTTDVEWSPGATNAGNLAFVSNGSTQVWNVWGTLPVGILVSSYPNTPNGVLAWSPDGHDLASASGSTIVIWNVNTGALLYTYTGHMHPVDTLAWSQDGNYMASGENSSSGTNSVRVWMA